MQIWPAIDLRGGKCVRSSRVTITAKRSSAMIPLPWPDTGPTAAPSTCTWSISTGPGTAASRISTACWRFSKPLTSPASLVAAFAKSP